MEPILTDSLLDELYASIVVRGDYAQIVDRLSAIFGTHSGAVLRREGDTLQFIRTHNLCPSLMADYNRELHKFDPWLRAEGARQACEITIGSKLVDPKAVEKTGFYEDFLKPHDIWDLLNTKVGEPPGPVIYFSFYRPRGRPFDNREAAIFAAVTKHLSRAHSLRVQISSGALNTALFLDGLHLTPHERRIADLLIEGFSYAAISETVGVTANTLKWHLRNIFTKASVHSKAAFIARAHGHTVPGK